MKLTSASRRNGAKVNLVNLVDIFDSGLFLFDQYEYVLILFRRAMLFNPEGGRGHARLKVQMAPTYLATLETLPLWGHGFAVCYLGNRLFGLDSSRDSQISHSREARASIRSTTN